MSEGQSALSLFTTLDLTLITTSFVILTGSDDIELMQ